MESQEILTKLLTECIDKMGDCGSVTTGQYELLERYLIIAFGMGFDEGRAQCAHRKSILKLKDGIIVGIYDSMTSAAKSVNGDKSHISKSVSGKRLKSYGFEWKLQTK